MNTHEDNSVWPPPPTLDVAPTPAVKQPFPSRFLILTLAASMLIGAIDAGTTGNTGDYLLGTAAFTLGVVKPRWFLTSAFLLVSCLFIAHAAAISAGLEFPYVENTIDDAYFGSFFAFLPLTIVASAGAFVGFVVRLVQKRKAGR